MNHNTEAKGELAIRTQCMPADTNPAGDIFGGWLLAQMDIAGSIVSKRVAKGRTVTIAVDSMEFHKPVFVGDVLCCHVEILKTGKTSIQTNVQAWVRREFAEDFIKVTEGKFTYVSVDENRKPTKIKKD